MSVSDSLAKKVARGIGGLALFFIAYKIAVAITTALVIPVFGHMILRSTGPEAFDFVLQLFMAVLAGYFGVVLGARVLDVVMKNYPARGIGAAFVIWLAANYFLHFIFFGDSNFIPDHEIYTGLLQSLVATVTAWFTFRLPPLSPLELVTSESGQAKRDASLTAPPMEKIAILFFIVLNFGWPLRWGLLF
jgi:hypothetical protein